MSDSENRLENEISKYVSNLDGDIYTVSNIPEEVVAVIFAYVSRSPKGFRENIGTVIQEEQLGQERASKFHEKWVLNYGHASVAEHASIHVGIENVSRLFSSELELSNEYLSFTEYSQRYQRPQRGNFYIPYELESYPDLSGEFKNVCNTQYDIYSELNDRLLQYLKDKIPVPESRDEGSHHRALEKIAFEDARYALNLSTFTNLGMTGNARAIEDSLTRLLSSRYPEVRKRAEEIKREVRFSAPTLVKYANENSYIKNSGKRIEKMSRDLFPEPADLNTPGPYVRLTDFTGMDSKDPEYDALLKMARSAVYCGCEASPDQIEDKLKDLGTERLLGFFSTMMEDLGKHDNPLNILKLVRYEAEFTISEACWHQLLRHRKINWTPREPSVNFGITIPPNIEYAGISEMLLEAAELSENLYSKLVNAGMRHAAAYVVSNAHNRKVMGSFDLWELYHLINLRMSEGAQWDIKQTVSNLAGEISSYHPNLVTPALERVK